MFGGNLFVIVNDGVTFIPITVLAGKSEEDIEALVVERVTADVMTRLVEVSGDAAAPAVAATGAVALGGLLAWIAKRTDTPGRALVTSLARLPYAVPGTVLRPSSSMSFSTCL